MDYGEIDGFNQINERCLQIDMRPNYEFAAQFGLSLRIHFFASAECTEVFGLIKQRKINRQASQSASQSRKVSVTTMAMSVTAASAVSEEPEHQLAPTPVLVQAPPADAADAADDHQRTRSSALRSSALRSRSRSRAQLQSGSDDEMEQHKEDSDDSEPEVSQFKHEQRGAKAAAPAPKPKKADQARAAKKKELLAKTQGKGSAAKPKPQPKVSKPKAGSPGSNRPSESPKPLQQRKASPKAEPMAEPKTEPKASSLTDESIGAMKVAELKGELKKLGVTPKELKRLKKAELATMLRSKQTSPMEEEDAEGACDGSSAEQSPSPGEWVQKFSQGAAQDSKPQAPLPAKPNAASTEMDINDDDKPAKQQSAKAPRRSFASDTKGDWRAPKAARTYAKPKSPPKADEAKERAEEAELAKAEPKPKTGLVEKYMPKAKPKAKAKAKAKAKSKPKSKLKSRAAPKAAPKEAEASGPSGKLSSGLLAKQIASAESAKSQSRKQSGGSAKSKAKAQPVPSPVLGGSPEDFGGGLDEINESNTPEQVVAASSQRAQSTRHTAQAARSKIVTRPMDEPSDAEEHSQSSAAELDLQPSDSSDSDSDAESDSSTAARQPAKLNCGGMDREKTRKLAAKELNSTLSSDSSDDSDDESDSDDEHSGGSGTRKLPEYSLARKLAHNHGSAKDEEEDDLFANMDGLSKGVVQKLEQSFSPMSQELHFDKTDNKDYDAMLSKLKSFSKKSQNARLRTREKNQAQAKHSIDSVFSSGKMQIARPRSRFTQVRKVLKARIADLENCESTLNAAQASKLEELDQSLKSLQAINLSLNRFSSGKLTNDTASYSSGMESLDDCIARERADMQKKGANCKTDCESSQFAAMLAQLS